MHEINYALEKGLACHYCLSAVTKQADKALYIFREGGGARTFPVLDVLATFGQLFGAQLDQLGYGIKKSPLKTSFRAI